jgi:predicted dehydrogenase
MDRRSFLRQAAGAVTEAAVLATTARSYARIRGANERLVLGHVGVGNRGRGLEYILGQIKDSHNVETAGVCDLWTINRERAVATAGTTFGRAPRGFANFEEMLAMKELDGIVISTPEHQHAPMLRQAAEAGKHVYVEKPMGNNLDELKAARDAVVARRLIVQAGTQRRSEPYQIAAKAWHATGVVGEMSKIEIVWNYHGPRWRGRPEVAQIREADTDWRRWLMTRPYRPFDPRLYFEYRLYSEFSSGIPDQWMSHGIDLAHWFMDDYFPTSVVANGGVFAWKDGRENPDTFQALLTYPKGVLVSYSTSFGNDAQSTIRLMGKQGTMINYGTEGTPRWKWVEERGNYEETPEIIRREKWLSLDGDGGRGPASTPDEDPSHMINWLDALRAGRQPSAPVEAGFAHSVACIMAARACREKRALYWNPQSETIVDQSPVEG